MLTNSSDSKQNGSDENQEKVVFLKSLKACKLLARPMKKNSIVYTLSIHKWKGDITPGLQNLKG